MESSLDYFDKIYCINLPERTDRWEKVQEEFDKLGIKDRVIRRNGIRTGGLPWLGCTMAHLEILHHANNERILIFEDDVKFVDKAKEHLSRVIEDLKNIDWTMFYLGGNICGKMQQVSYGLARLTHAQSTHAYALDRGVAEQLLSDKRINLVEKELDRVYAEEAAQTHTNEPPYMGLSD